MFGSFLHPFVLSNVYVLEILFVFIYAYWNAETLVTWCTRQKMKTSESTTQKTKKKRKQTPPNHLGGTQSNE